MTQLHGATTRSLAVPLCRLTALAVLVFAADCRNDLPTSPLKSPGGAMHATSSTPAVEFYVHGSPEDWQIFMGNLTAPSLQSGRKVVVVHTTAGDGGQPAKYWQTREKGAQASVDQVLGAGTWTCAKQSVNGHSLQRCTKANAVLYFMRMPDGNYWDGTGYGLGSLSNLRDQGAATKAIDGSTTYVSWADFTNTIQALISTESQGQPASAVAVHSPDYDRTINPNDHPDNSATGDAIRAAVAGMGWTITWYIDYQTEYMSVNLSQADHDTKKALFLAYNTVMVNAGYASEANDPDIAQWLWRTYYRVSSPVPPAAPTALVASSSSKGRVDLSWTDNANNETGFWVERAPDSGGTPGAFAQIGTVGANVGTYSDLSVSPGTTYWFRVRAYNDGGTSAYTNTASVKTLTSMPLPYRGDAYIIAHADDWQIFMGDHTYASFQAAAAMLFIYSTAGDGGQPSSYWLARERAALASIDAVIGSGTWACASRSVRTHPIYRCTKSAVVVYFMRMPDGNYIDGTGYGYGSIEALRDHGTPTSALDGSTTYSTWADFYTTLGAIVDFEFDGQSSPYVKVNAQEYNTKLDPNDHPDHNGTGGAVNATAALHNWDLTYYVGYDTENRPINITDTQHSQKMLEWTAYNNSMVASGYASDLSDTEYNAWVWRTYFRSVSGTAPALSAPTNLAANAASTSQIDLTWTDNTTTETGFYIEQAPDNAGAPGTFSRIATVGANVTAYASTGLAAGTTYWYRVQATDGTNVSTYSNSAAATTQQPPPPAAPSGLTAAVVSGTEIDLSWADNSTNESGFRIERAPDAGGVAGTYTEIALVGAGVTSYASTGLTAGTAYWFRVRAYNASGTSAYSNAVSATTSAPPAAPTNLAAQAVSTTEIDLTWADNSSNEAGFYIEQAPDNAGAPGTFARIATVAANVTSYANTALATGTKYWYRVQAYNVVGASAYTNAAAATTLLPPPPAAPSGLTAAVASGSEIDLSWTSNSTNESGFRIERAPDAGGVAGAYTEIGVVGAGVTTYASAGLASGTAYWYRVRAYNASGTSAYSNAVSATTLAAPAAPTNLAAQAVSTSEIDLTWTDNSANETGFYVEQAPDNAGAPGTFSRIATLGANVTSYANTALAAGTKYWYRVQAYNAVGSSAYTNAAAATTLLPPPPAAPSALVAAVVSGSEIDLSWTINSTNESGFRIERAPDAGGVAGTYSEIAVVAAGVSTYNNSGLTAGTTYWYRVRAYNANGTSGYSNAVSATTLAPPAAPTALQLQAISTGEIDLTWTDNSTNETGFSVERAPDNNGTAGTFAVIATVAANVTSYANTGLATGTKYWYRVQAYNGVGSSAYTNSASAATLLPPPPAAPSGLTASATSTSQINLAWTDNSTTESGFRIERALDAGGVPGTYTEIAIVGARSTAYSSTGLTAGTAYWFRVRAYNAGGTSAYSNEASATTQAMVVAAPTNLVATAASATSIALTWTDNATNETGYLIERAPDAGGVAGTYAQIASLAANSTTYTNTGLAASTKYWYRVRAAGTPNSAYSNEAAAMTLAATTVPAAPTNFTATLISEWELDLAWADNSNQTSFTLQRAPDNFGSPGTYATIASPAGNVFAFNNTGLVADTKYWYRIRANNASGSSAWVVMTAETSSPNYLTVTSTSVSGVATATLKWATTGLPKVDIWRDNVLIAAAVVNSGAATDGNRVPGTTSEYQVCNAGFHDYDNCSNSVTITY